MIKSPAAPADDADRPAAMFVWQDGDALNTARVEIPASDTPNAIVEISSLGYKRAMTTEVRTAPRWGNPIADFLRYLRAQDQSPGTVYQRGYQLRVMSQAFRGRSPWTLTTDDIAGFLASQTQHSNSTRRAMFSAVRGFYRYGADTGKITGPNPAAALKPPKPIEGVPRPAPIDDIVSAIDRADDRTRLMIYLGVYGGLRRAEIAAVHTRDLFREPGGWSLRVIGKGRKLRHVPMTNKLAALIQAQPDGWLFPSWHRGQIDSDGKTCDDHLRPARVGELIRAVLPPGVTPHMLRHRYATNRYATNGHDLIALAKLLGHASVATTEGYTQLPDDALRRGNDDAADLIR